MEYLIPIFLPFALIAGALGAMLAYIDGRIGARILGVILGLMSVVVIAFTSSVVPHGNSMFMSFGAAILLVLLIAVWLGYLIGVKKFKMRDDSERSGRAENTGSKNDVWAD